MITDQSLSWLPFQDDRACWSESAGGRFDCRTQPRIWISPRSPRKKVFAALTKKDLQDSQKSIGGT